MFYGFSVIVFCVVSFLIPYYAQVYLSIAAGLAVAILLPVSVALVRSFTPSDIIFIVGILFLVIGLIQSGLPVRAVLESFRHIAFFASIGLTSLYIVLEILRSTRIRSRAGSMRGFGAFLAVCSTTLSSELCSCLHPALILEALGIPAFLQNLVSIGFAVMMTTLVNQIRLTYGSYKSMRNGNKPLRNV